MCGEAREQKPSKKESVMGVKQYKPTSPGRRFQTVSDFAEITTSKPEKSLLAPLHKKAGRNNKGRITVRHQGGGNKRRYRIIDFKRNKDGVPAKVATVEYDPNRSARIALLHYVDGEKRYILHPKGLKVGDMVVSGPEADIKPGNALPLASPLVRGSTRLSSSLARAPLLRVPLARASSSWVRKASTRFCVCRPPKCVASF